MKFVDQTFNEDDSKYAYTNKDGGIEGVELDNRDGIVYLQYGVTLEHESMSEIYAVDIPNMIKALQAAYQEYQEYQNVKEQV